MYMCLIYGSLFMIAHFSCVSVFVTTLHYPTKDHSYKVLLVDSRLPPFPSFFHQSCCVAQADFQFLVLSDPLMLNLSIAAQTSSLAIYVKDKKWKLNYKLQYRPILLQTLFCFKVLNFFLCVYGWSAYMDVCVPLMCMVPSEARRGHQINLVHEFLIVSYHVGAGYRTWALWKNSQCPKPESFLQPP